MPGFAARLLLLSALLGCLVASPQPVFAEQSRQGNENDAGATRTIEGHVLSKEGANVAGAVVLLKDGKTLQVRSYIAQADGAYHFYGLSVEVNYTLRAEKQDLTSKPKTVSVFDSHRDVHLNLKLTQQIKPPKK